MKIRWLPTAAENFDTIYYFYYQLRPTYAEKLYVQIMKEINMLLQFPQMAAKEQFLEKAPRQFRSLVICKRIKTIYYIKDEIIYIADIWDCRQNPTKLSPHIR